MIKFKEWLNEATNQLSRQDVANLVNWTFHLSQNLGYFAAKIQDRTAYNGDYSRLQRITKQGLHWFEEAIALLGAKGTSNIVEIQKQINSGQHDKVLIQFAGKIVRAMKSLRANFDQIGFDTSNMKSFAGLEAMTEKLSYIPWQSA